MRPLLDFIPLAQFVFCFSIALFALSSLGYLLYRQSKTRERLISIPIFINIVSWIVTASFDLTYTSSSMFSWLTYGELFGVNATMLFWTGATFFAGTTAVSLSVFFLLLDRCFILIGPKWLNERSKRRLYKVNAVCVAADFIIVLTLFIAFEKADIVDTRCQTFSCVTVGKARTLNIIRMFYGSLNTVLASVFAVLLHRYNRKRDHSSNYSSSSRVKSNIIAGINVLSQILFNFLPNLAAFIALECFGVALSSSSGPVVSTFSQIDALCTTIVYLKVVGERVLRKKITSSVMPTTVITSRY